MIARVYAPPRSFAEVARDLLHDAKKGNERPESADRVDWTDTRNLPTLAADRAAQTMAATAKAAPELKRQAGGSPGGRPLQHPAFHYALYWSRDHLLCRAEMCRAADETLRALGLHCHQALIVAHRDTNPSHVHVLVNRVHPETGKAAKLHNDRLKLSRWAERCEREHGAVKCPERAKNNGARDGMRESAT